jgi:hypothetical protein
MQRFWDSTLALESPDEECDSRSEVSLLLASETGDGKSSIYPPVIGNSFAFKLQDQKGRVHRFTCGSESLNELASSIKQRLSITDEEGIMQLLVQLSICHKNISSAFIIMCNKETKYSLP